jgi:hypothetical protein
MNPFDVDSPQTAKFRLGLRPGLNYLLVGAIFISVAVVFDNAVCSIVTGVALYFVLTNFLDQRPIRFRCPECKRVILSNTPWVCKSCGEINRSTDDHSFLSKCKNETCGVEPKAYRCHHKGCGRMIFFTEDHDDTNYASCLNAASEKPKPDERAEKVRADSEEIEDKRRKITKAELDEKLNEIERRSKVPKMKTPFEKKKEEADQYYDEVMGMREYAKKRKAEAAEMYKDDPDSLKEAYEAIDAAVKRGI